MNDDTDRLKSIQELSSVGDEVACEAELVLYLAEYSESIKARILLGGLLFSQGRHEHAKPFILYVLERIPYQPHCSVALFHILWDEGSKLNAMNILHAYLINSDSEIREGLKVRSEFEAIKNELECKGLWKSA